ncbi:disease resistance protein RPM1-like [Eucalyptus grandis]|uniref:disease resistance protein RPM1-like n=1 Tax=Eucalyptus grandis TaxID=71139 RepID=UPI00192EEA7A|nr:disease resistance protein RPM1-like [Eucalyptus grandis]
MAASDTRSCMMIAGAAAQIVSQKLDILLPHPACVECFPMQACAEDAKAKLATIQDFISTQYGPSKTTEWLGRLLRAMDYAEEFIDKFHLREARERHEALRMAARPLASLVSKCKLWRDLSMLVNMMEELCDEKFLKEGAEGKRKKEHASSSSHASVPWQGKKLARLTSFWDGQVPTNFLCREAEKTKIMSWIKETSGETEWTSIWGEQGTGKTFLARWVYSQSKYMGYEWRAWVHVSGSLDEREILFEILKQVEKLARDEKDMDTMEIMMMLRQKLTEKNRFLIVLDDVRPSDEQFVLVLAFSIPLSSKGHIITITQDSKIAKLTDTSKAGPIRLENLGNEESQRMLAWKLYGVSEGQRLSEKEKDVLNKCRGLPLRISLLGGFMSNAGEQEHTALAEEGFKLDILKLSCHKLPVHLKPCFIYMALFPVAIPIPTRRLVRLWLAEGLLDSHCYDRERKRQPEDVGETFILELANRNVIDVVSWRADGSPKACQMITSLYDMIRPIAMSLGFLHIHDTSKSKDKNDRDPNSQQQQLLAQLRERTKIRWIAEHTNIVRHGHSGSYPGLNLSHVRSFLSFYLRRGVLTKDISTFLGKMTSETDYSFLRVLDLEGVYKPSLQGVLHKLVLLRYLGLRSTVLDSIPSTVADLHHLETLDIKNTNITSLPNSLWKARNLRHLNLNWFYIDLKKILKACGDNVNALTELQTLSGLVIGEVKENPMTGHMNCMTTLTTLKLFLQHSDNDTSGAAGKTVAHWISFRLTNLQSLTFGVIQEAKPAEEAQTTKEAKLTKKEMKVAQAEGEAQLAEEDKVDQQPPGEAQLAEKATKEATKVSKPSKKAKPVTSQVGPLPELLLAEQHHELLELYLLGQLNNPSWTQLLPVSLRVLTLSGSRVKADMIPQLGGLLKQLRTFRLLANSFLGTSLRFAKDGFPSLVILKIWKLPCLQELIIEKGAMLHLKELEFRHLDAIKNVEGINECKELENICLVVKQGAHDFVDHLRARIGRMMHMYKREDIETLEPKDDDEDDRDKKGDILYLHI